MTATTKEIFDRYEVRKSKKQKTAFIEWLRSVVKESGYEMRVEKGSFGARNIVIGDPEAAKVVFTAHYDTCAVLPFPNFITPKCVAIYLLYQLVLVVGMFAVVFAAAFLGGLISKALILPAYYIALLAVCGGMILGPANKHTANDNTSGVTAVLDLMNAMPEILKRKAAFVLFDLEEAGLIGSASFASKHKKTMTNKPLVNLDCVSDGGTVLFCFRKKSKALVEQFRQAFPSDDRVETEFVTKGYVYPSDQANFPCGVGIAAMNKTKGGMLYMDKIHTSKDRVYREENIAYLVEGCIRLVEKI